jgi:hypothetical protein
VVRLQGAAYSPSHLSTVVAAISVLPVGEATLVVPAPSLPFAPPEAHTHSTAGRQIGGSAARRPFSVANSLRCANGETGPFRSGASALKGGMAAAPHRRQPVAGGRFSVSEELSMRRPMVFAAMVAVLLLSAAPAAFAGGVTHAVSAGGPDICRALDARPGCDGNLSLSAIQYADGSVTGTLTDRSTGSFGNHGVIDCLSVVGNEAWVSGVITSGFLVGFPFSSRVLDAGTSANQGPDQISFTRIGPFAPPCTAHADAELFDAPDGQVTVK